MTLPSSSTGGSLGHRQIRSLYPRITEKHLQYLEKWGLLRPSTLSRERREYSFADAQTIKQLATELDRGTPLKTILRTMAAEHQGQLQLDFQEGVAGGDAPRAKVVALDQHRARREATATQNTRGMNESPKPYNDPQSALAAKYFVEGSRLDDGDESTMEAGAAASRKALIVDPDLVPAIVNLANIHYGRDELIEAQALYERAINLEGDCFEAHFNLGNILHDLGRFDRALVCYRNAVALNGSYPEAHFYLAVTLEKTGHSPEAKSHWKAYQELAPDGEWIELAKEFTE
jgi:tetratricopeptide (TPR) repeat protein